MSRTKSIWNALLRFFASITLSSVVLAGLVSPAAASSRSVVSGTYVFVLVSQTTRTRGQDIIITEHAHVIYSGGITGTTDDHDSYVVHPDGTYETFGEPGIEICAPCTIGNKTGSFTARYRIKGNAITYRGFMHLVSGAGGLEGLHGGGHFQLDAAGNSTYSYSYSFDREE
jgi:hypothetical protein